MPSLCAVSGTVYDQSGVVSPDARLVITPLSVAGILMSSHSRVVKAVAGVVSFNEVQGTTVRIEGNVLGYDDDDGTNVLIPSTPTATLEGLTSVPTYPTTGLVVQDEGVPLSGFYGTLNIIGGAVAATQASPGIANITVTAAAPVWGGITGTLSDQTDLNTALGQRQPLDADLTAIAALAGTSGLLKKTAADTWSLDTTAYASQAYADSLVVGLLDDRGNYNASVNTFPASGGSGAAGAILKGDLFTISVAGTLGGHPVTAGDVVRALVDTPGQTDGNWAITENNFGYVAANAALSNLSTTSINSDLLPASTQKIGSPALPWLEGYFGNTTQYESVTQSAGLVTHTVAGSATNIGYSFVVKGTGQVLFPAGAAGTPAMSFAGDPDTGFFNPSANVVNLTLGGNNGYYNFAQGAFGLYPNLTFLQIAAQISWASDIAIARSASGILELNNLNVGRWAGLKAGFYGAATNSVANGITIGTRSSGTPAAGLGAGLLFNIDSSTTPDSNAAQIAALWTDSTHATRRSNLIFSTVTGGGALTTGMTLDASNLYVVGSVVTSSGSIVGRGNLVAFDSLSGLSIASTTLIGFSSTTDYTGAKDGSISRISAGLLGVGTGAAGSFAGGIKATVFIHAVLTFATLPATPAAGMLVGISDSNVATFGTTITAGGGANKGLAYYDGAAWTFR